MSVLQGHYDKTTLISLFMFKAVVKKPAYVYAPPL